MDSHSTSANTMNETCEIIRSNNGTSIPVGSVQTQSVNTEVKGGQGGSGLTTTSKKRSRAKTSICWSSGWFTPIDPKDSKDGKKWAKCTKCDLELKADPKTNGTSGLNAHIKLCPNRENLDIKQMFMQKVGGKMALRGVLVNPDTMREMVLTLIVKNELPLRFVEYEEFRKLMDQLYIYPEYTTISRVTLLTNVQKIFNKEKKNIKEIIKNSCGRIFVTTDLWTSISNDGYMTLAAHYIDREWVLHKILITFTVLTPPHSGAHICEKNYKILNEWGIEKSLFSVTVDNASSNDAFVSMLRSSLVGKNTLVCKGEFFHIRCCAHILNLIVQNGIKLIDESVQKVRDSIKFVKSSQARKVRFSESCDNMGLNTKRGLHGDVTTRWNSTFQMLDNALFYQKAFENLGHLDLTFKEIPTKYNEWERIEKLTKFLKPFDEITKDLSGS